MKIVKNQKAKIFGTLNLRLSLFVLGVAVACQSFLTGQTLFQKTFDTKFSDNITKYDWLRIYSMVQLNDNEFILAGREKYQFKDSSENESVGNLIKMDSLGSVKWVKHFTEFGLKGFFNEIEQLNDGNILCSGLLYNDLETVLKFFIIKLNTAGETIWMKSFDMNAVYSFEAVGDNNKLEIQEDEFGNIYTGNTHFIAKFDKNGSLLWQKSYNNFSDSKLYVNAIQLLPSGDLYAVGELRYNDWTIQTKYQGIFLKINKDNGEIIFCKKYASDDKTIKFSTLNLISKNEFIVSGMRFKQNGGYTEDGRILLKMNLNGDTIWSRTNVNSPVSLNGIHNQFAFLAPDTNSIYLLGCDLTVNGYLSKFSFDGKKLWSKGYGGCSHNIFYTMAAGNNNTLYLFGHSLLYTDQSNGLLIRSDSSGYTSCYDTELNHNYISYKISSSPLTIIESNPVFIIENHLSVVENHEIEESFICISTKPVHTSFHAEDTVFCAGTCISFFNDSTLMHNGYGEYVVVKDTINPTIEKLKPAGIYFKWDFQGATFPDGADTLENPTNICYDTPGDYTVRLIVTDLCKIDTLLKENYIHVSEANPKLNISGDSSLCGNGATQLIVSGAESYSWLPVIGLNDPTNDTIIANPTQTTTYTVTGSLVGDCTGSKQVTIAVGNEVIANAGVNDTICWGESTMLTGSGGQTFTWSSNQTTRTITVSPDTTTNYIFTAIDGSCDDVDTIEVFVEEAPIVIITPKDMEVEKGSFVNIEATGGATYSWSPTLGLSCSDCPTPVAIPSNTTNYCVTVTSINGCKADKCVNITVTYNCGELFIPNSFSPNEDNNNDKLEVKINADCVSEYNFWIFDRWGEKVFESADITESWDGKYNGKELDNAVFVYRLKMKLMNETEYIKKTGNVSIIK